MPRQRKYLDIDVLTAAKQRIHHIFDTFDSVTTCFSGGKDSLAVLHLFKEVSEERGIAIVNALFRDEEVIPNQVVDFVNFYRRQPWLKLLWFTVPLASERFCLGKTLSYIQWDPGRRHVREKPPWGINLEPGDNRVLSQYSMDEYAAQWYKGKVAFLTGIRAAESLIRYRASVNKLNDNYINASQCKRVSLCKPIYDWEENDVFRYFYDRGIKYCPWYDQQMFGGHKFRIATPVTSEEAKQVLVGVDPEFYDRVIQTFPEMAVQFRYWKEFDREAVFEKFAKSYDTIREYVRTEMPDAAERAKALAFVRGAEARVKSGSGEWALRDILRHVVNGQYRNNLITVTNKFDERRSTKSA